MVILLVNYILVGNMSSLVAIEQFETRTSINEPSFHLSSYQMQKHSVCATIFNAQGFRLIILNALMQRTLLISNNPVDESRSYLKSYVLHFMPLDNRTVYYTHLGILRWTTLAPMVSLLFLLFF